MKKKGRGAIEEVVDINNDIVVCAWYDNKRVVTVSNYLGQNPVSECDGYSQSQKKKIKLPHPTIVQVYNKWVEWIKQTCLFLCIKQNARQKNGIIKYFSTFLLYQSSMHEQYIQRNWRKWYIT